MATEFWKLRDPKEAKLKAGYSSDASLGFQSWLKDIQIYVSEHHLSQQEAFQLVKDYTSEHAQVEVEYYLGLTPESKQSFLGHRSSQSHISILQDCQFPDRGFLQLVSEGPWEWEYVYRWAASAVLVWKIVAHKAEILGKANQALKHQFAQNLRVPYFGVVTRGQCMSSPDSEIFTQFQGWLALMFNSRGKHAKAVYATSVTVDNDTEQQLSHNSQKRQNKIDAQATEISTVKA